MGMVYKQQGRYEEALDYYHRSLDIKVRVVGHEHRTWPTAELALATSFIGWESTKRRLFSTRKR